MVAVHVLVTPVSHPLSLTVARVPEVSEVSALVPCSEQVASLEEEASEESESLPEAAVLSAESPEVVLAVAEFP